MSAKPILPASDPWTWIPPVTAFVLALVVAFTHSNTSVFLAINHFGHKLPPAVWANLTMLGDGAVVLCLLLPMARRWPLRFWAGITGALLVGLIVQIAKHSGPHPRPPAVLAADQFFQTGPRLMAVSFPSGHTSAAFILAGILVMTLRGRPLLQSLAIVLACLVGVSRIMVGVHWPLDVLGGIVTGWVSAWVALRFCMRMGWRTGGRAGLLMTLGLMGIAVGLLFSHHVGFPAALPLQRLIGLVCLLFGAHALYRMRTKGSQ